MNKTGNQNNSKGIVQTRLSFVGGSPSNQKIFPSNVRKYIHFQKCVDSSENRRQIVENPVQNGNKKTSRIEKGHERLTKNNKIFKIKHQKWPGFGCMRKVYIKVRITVFGFFILNGYHQLLKKPIYNHLESHNCVAEISS